MELEKSRKFSHIPQGAKEPNNPEGDKRRTWIIKIKIAARETLLWLVWKVVLIWWGDRGGGNTIGGDNRQ